MPSAFNTERVRGIVSDTQKVLGELTAPWSEVPVVEPDLLVRHFGVHAHPNGSVTRLGFLQC